MKIQKLRSMGQCNDCCRASKGKHKDRHRYCREGEKACRICRDLSFASSVAAVQVAQLFDAPRFCHAVDFAAFGREHGAEDATAVAEFFQTLLPDVRTAEVQQSTETSQFTVFDTSEPRPPAAP